MSKVVYIPQEEVRAYLKANGYNFSEAAKAFKVSRAFISNMFKEEFPAGSRSMNLDTQAGRCLLLLKDAFLTNAEIAGYLQYSKTSRIGERRNELFGYRDICKICRRPEAHTHKRCRRISGRRAVKLYQLKKSLSRSKIR